MASISATRMGMYSGRHPAMTPLTATFHTVARRWSGRRTPSSVSYERSVQRRNSATRSGVGGTMGRPSLQSFS